MRKPLSFPNSTRDSSALVDESTKLRVHKVTIDSQSMDVMPTRTMNSPGNRIMYVVSRERTNIAKHLIDEGFNIVGQELTEITDYNTLDPYIASEIDDAMEELEDEQDEDVVVAYSSKGRLQRAA